MRRANPFNYFRHNHGSALIYVLIVVAVISIFAVTMQQVLLTSRHHLKLQQQRALLSTIGATLQLQVTNPAFLKASMLKDGSPGNRMLLACTGVGFKSTEESTPACFMAPAADKPYSFDLVESKGQNPCVKEKLDSLHCLVAGRSVGYNLKGEIGKFSKDYPIRAEVFFKPLCTNLDGSPAKSPCHFARSIQVGYRLSHVELLANGSEKISYLGTYPKEILYTTVPLSHLIEEQCNEGAAVAGYDAQGNIQCACRPPFLPTGTSNQRGPLCEIHAERCPEDSVMVGLKADGTPACERLSNKTGAGLSSWEKTICAANFRAQDGSCLEKEADCSEGPDGEEGGWITDIKVNCSSGIKFEVAENECPDALFDLAEDVGKTLKFDEISKFIMDNLGTHIGVSSDAANAAIGAAIGALVGGPIGAVTGALIGGFWEDLKDLFGEEEYHLYPKSKAVCFNNVAYPTCQTKTFAFTLISDVANTDFARSIFNHDSTVDLNAEVFGTEDGKYEIYSCPYVQCTYTVSCQGFKNPSS